MSNKKSSKPTDLKQSLKKLSNHLREQNATLKKLLGELSSNRTKDIGNNDIPQK